MTAATRPILRTTPQPGLAPWTAALTTLGIGFPALVLAGRGMAGALTTRLPTPWLLGTAGAAILLASLGSRAGGRTWPAALAPQGALGLLLGVLSVASGWSWALAVVWLAALAQAVWSLRRGLSTVDSPVRLTSEATRQPRAQIEDDEVAPDDDLLATSRRHRAADGPEWVAGRVRVDFLPGHRVGRAHVAFCPPLPGRPEIELEQADGPPARVQLGQSQAHGARFDVKLTDEPSEPVSVWIEYVARFATQSPGGSVDHWG